MVYTPFPLMPDPQQSFHAVGIAEGSLVLTKGNFGTVRRNNFRFRIHISLYGHNGIVHVACGSTRQTPPSSRCQFTGRTGTCSPL
jgi:hypothetical protein